MGEENSHYFLIPVFLSSIFIVLLLTFKMLCHPVLGLCDTLGRYELSGRRGTITPIPRDPGLYSMSPPPICERRTLTGLLYLVRWQMATPRTTSSSTGEAGTAPYLEWSGSSCHSSPSWTTSSSPRMWCSPQVRLGGFLFLCLASSPQHPPQQPA